MRAALCALLAIVPTLSGATYCITVAGLGGEPDYDQRFSAWAADLDKTLKSSGADVKAETLSGAQATKANIKSKFESVAKQITAQDALVVMMIGHGSFDGTEYKFNLPGPDLSSSELAAMLDRVTASRQLVVNMTSASGASVHALLKQNRAVITATKSGTERNATVFPRYWIEALRDANADTDKNETISALEAYQYASQKTKAFYETNKRIATEHPLLDGGDQNGPLNAGRFSLLRMGALQAAYKDPAKQAMLAKREQLEAQIDDLKFRKAALPTDQYRKELSALLLDLARVQEELDK